MVDFGVTYQGYCSDITRTFFIGKNGENEKSVYDAVFAAKEAAMKALGTGWRRGISWQDFEIANLPSGKPCLQLSGRALEFYRSLGGSRILVSLTHTGPYALAQVIIESDSLESDPARSG